MSQYMKNPLQVLQCHYYAKNIVTKYASYILVLLWNYAAAHMQIILVISASLKLRLRQESQRAFAALKPSQGMVHCVILKSEKKNSDKNYRNQKTGFMHWKKKSHCSKINTPIFSAAILPFMPNSLVISKSST